jgi:hypothetical protein
MPVIQLVEYFGYRHLFFIAASLRRTLVLFAFLCNISPKLSKA